MSANLQSVLQLTDDRIITMFGNDHVGFENAKRINKAWYTRLTEIEEQYYGSLLGTPTLKKLFQRTHTNYRVLVQIRIGEDALVASVQCQNRLQLCEILSDSINDELLEEHWNDDSVDRHNIPVLVRVLESRGIEIVRGFEARDMDLMSDLSDVFIYGSPDFVNHSLSQLKLTRPFESFVQTQHGYN